ncbi:sigma-70 family RNA polymerase sigma factor [Patescibacteria group bacterium]|jgi:RNA polymerase sigma-70 factor (ECF subfamily)|nr:sigma-70 family RNA polymerase sigma factor [Patescibacteria group bacterium]
MHTDIELALQAKGGDRQAFGQLYDRFAVRVLRYLSYKTRHKETAEDLTSHVFEKVLTGFAGFRGTTDISVAAWIFTIAERTFIDYTRKKKAVPLPEFADVPETNPTKEKTERGILMQQVHDALQQLPESQRLVVELRVIAGLSHQEIAERLGKTEGNSKVLFSRAVKALQTSLLLTLLSLFPPL